MLRDCFVVGITDERIQRRLLSEKDDLTFQKAFEIAIAMELAAKNAHVLHHPPPVMQDSGPIINKVSQFRGRRTQFTWSRADAAKGNTRGTAAVSNSSTRKSCHSCGGNHLHDTCKFRDALCHKCQRMGHIASVCKSYMHPSHNNYSRAANRYTHVITEDSTPVVSSTADECYTLYHMPADDTISTTMSFALDEHAIMMEVDTGASVSLISEETFNKYWNSDKLSPPSLVLKTYTGERLDLLGECDVNVTYKSQSATLPLRVVRGKGPSLYG